MTDRLAPRPMQGRGFYNQHSQGQHAADQMGVPAIADAAGRVPLGDPVVIADYGSSQGRNSLEPMAAAIAAIRGRDADVPITVYHTDVPGNDFSSLFEVLESAQTYVRPGVFAYATGHSFYHPLFAPGTVSLGWSAAAMHWLSQAPGPSDHLWPPLGSPSFMDAWRRQAALDWRTLLSRRARELRVGARLVMVNGLGDETGACGVEALIDAMDRVARELEAEGVIRPEERAAMRIVAHFRTGSEFRAPFAQEQATAERLALVSMHESDLPWPSWLDFQRDGDAARLAESTAGWARGWAGPGLEAGLDASRTAEDRQRISDDLWERVRRRIVWEPSLGDCRWRMAVQIVERTA